MNKSIKRMSYISMLLAMAVLLHYVESLIPIPFPVPGVKLGFANIIGLIAYFLFDFKVMIGVNLARVTLATLLAGTFLGTGFWLSLFGVSLSTVVVCLVGLNKNVSIVLISIISSIAHCVGQIIFAYFEMGSTILFYLPIMLLISIPTGIFTGYIASEVLKRMKKDFGKEL